MWSDGNRQQDDIDFTPSRVSAWNGNKPGRFGGGKFLGRTLGSWLEFTPSVCICHQENSYQCSLLCELQHYRFIFVAFSKPGGFLGLLKSHQVREDNFTTRWKFLFKVFRLALFGIIVNWLKSSLTEHKVAIFGSVMLILNLLSDTAR